MEAIYILILAGLYLLSIAFNKKDSTLIFFSGFLLLLDGLFMLNQGLIGVKDSFWFGLVFSFLAIYIMVRTAIEMILDGRTKNKETLLSRLKNKIWQKKK